MLTALPANTQLPLALVVDDDAVSRLLISRLLAKHGFAVVEADNGLDAFAQVQQTPFALAVVDIGLPGVSGNVLCQMIRDLPDGADLPILAYTARQEIKDIALMRMAGFNDILFKPVDQRALDAALERTLVPA